MPNFLENLGLDSFMESEDAIRGLLGYIANKGEAFQGYTKDITIFLPSGSIDFFVRLIHDSENERYLIDGLDTHICGTKLWKIRIEDDITPDDAEPLTKRLLITNHGTGNGLAVVNVLNSHMLPSLMRKDVYDFQVCAFPTEIDYFQDEKAYMDSIPKTVTGQTYGLAKGTIFPSGFFHNHDPRNSGKEIDYSSDELVLIMGEVERVFWGSFELEGEKYRPFVICEIDTQFGLLRIAHTVDQVNEDQRGFMKPGCVVSGIFALSADAAIGDYEKGAALGGEEKCLMALRYAMCKGETERLRAVLSEEVIYESKTTGKVYRGAETVIDRIQYVRQESGKKYESHPATIDSISDNLTDPDCLPGKRCFILKDRDAEGYESIAFVDTDDAGKLVRIVTTDSPDYTFALDKYPHPEEFSDDSEVPTDYYKAIFLRAMAFGWIDQDFDIDMIYISDDFDETLEDAAEALRNISQKDIEEQQDYLRNLFGYCFALGFQYMISDDTDGDYSGIEEDDPVFHCSEEDKPLFRKVYEEGKAFFIDYKIREGVDISSEESILDILAALRFLCNFGFECATEERIDTLRENLRPDVLKSEESSDDADAKDDDANDIKELLEEYSTEEDRERIRNRAHLAHLKTLCECYSTGNFEPLFFFLAEDVVLESQWVMQPNVGKEAVVEYLSGKGRTLQKNNCCPKCGIVRLVGNLNSVEGNISVNGKEPERGKVGLWYPDGKLCMYMTQTLGEKTNGVIVDIKTDDHNMISRIDLCMPELFRFEPYEDEPESAEEMI